MRLDATNLQLLHLLLKNGRSSVTDLAQLVGRSESAVRERLASLEAGGCLRGYRAQVDLACVGLRAHALVRARADPRRIPELGRRLAAIPNVVRATVTTGDKPILIEILAADLPSLEMVLQERIGALELEALETDVCMQTLVDHRPPDVLALVPDRTNGHARPGTPPILTAGRAP